MDEMQTPPNAERARVNIDISSWKTVDDVVMGGRSRSNIVEADGVLRFEGEVSLENNGGFCSARNAGLWDLGGATGLVWTMRGSSRDFEATLRTAEIPESTSFRCAFRPEADWQDFDFKFDDFRLFRRGQLVSEVERPDPSQLVSFGFLLADASPGPFWLELKRILANT